jgi:hypothetical protein
MRCTCGSCAGCDYDNLADAADCRQIVLRLVQEVQCMSILFGLAQWDGDGWWVCRGRARWDWLIGINGTASLKKGQALGALGPWGTVCSYGAALAAHVARLVALPRLHSLHSLHSRQMAGQGLQRGPSHVPDLVVGGRSRGGPDGTELNRLMGECCRMLQMGTSPFPNSRPKMCCMMSNSIISQQSV